MTLPRAATHSQRWAYASMIGGAGLVGASFVFERRADEDYARYLEATDPKQISRLYDRTRSFDQLSTATLIGGETLLAVGLWMRFLRASPRSRVAMEWHADRCALSLRF